MIIKQLISTKSNCSTKLVNLMSTNSNKLPDGLNSTLRCCLVSKDSKICGLNSLTRIIQSNSINQMPLKLVDLSSRSLGGGGGGGAWPGCGGVLINQ